MSDRTCLDCGTDISARHLNAKRCLDCARLETQRVQRSRPARETRPRGVDLSERACSVCHVVFKPGRSSQQTCSGRCQQYARVHPGHRDEPAVCGLCGEAIPVGATRSRRYCSPKCRSAAEKRRNRMVVADYVLNSACAHCGQSFPGKVGRKYCSRECSSREHLKPGSYSARAGRTCEHCGKPLSDRERINRRHCSDRCTVIANQITRRARRKGLPAERFSRFEIFERDRWTCHICRLPVDPDLGDRDPMSASIDHLIPLAHPDSPGHLRENVALAHLRCNISKNHRVTEDDWGLYTFLVLEAMQDGGWTASLS